MRVLRIIVGFVNTIIFLSMLALSVMVGALLLTLPRAHGAASIPGLSAAVDISFDGDGVPRIHAANALDGAAALGFVHARDRLFQMELMRRAASGRVSELAGPAALRLDRTMRVLGLRRRAEADLAGLPPEAHAMLDAYARGVNAWIAEHGRFSAAQFVVLGRPEPWSPVDSLLWAKTMGLYLSGNWRSEIARAALVGQVPRAVIEQLWPPQQDTPGPSASGGDPRYAALAGRLDALVPRFPAPFTLPDNASNEWAVDGAHSTTGAPLLAGDPHLGYSTPGIWYLARIDTPGDVLAGATAPGVPFIVIGRNSHIAWTFTTTGADTQDVFEETVLPDGRYATPTGPAAFITHQEHIAVRGQPAETMTVRETRHGPVVSDIAGSKGPVYAAEMADLQPGDIAAAGLLALNRASSVAEAGLAAAQITSPVQNLLVADAHSIGQFTTGRVPIRGAGDGDWPEPGADGAHDWVGWASGTALPHVIDPPSGHIVNANERVAPANFPVFMGRDWFGDWRARRIRTLLGTRRLSVADFAAMQVDVTDSFAQAILPILRAVPRQDDLAGHAAALLDGWNGAMTMDAPQPLIFNAWIHQFNEQVLQHANVPTTAGRPWADFVAWVLSPAGASWCGGDCTKLLDQSLHDAAGDLARRYGADPAAWRWRDAHVAVFSDPVLPPLSARIPQPGDATTIFVGEGVQPVGNATHGPGYRGVYDLADLDRSLFITAPGESGNPLSPHAYDLLRRWRDGGGITLGPNPARVDATLKLTR
jgi:penicillin amidase